MSTRKHHGHSHLTGEHKSGDLGQLIFLILFLGVWITDSFIFHYSTFLNQVVPDYVRIPSAALVLISGWLLARNGLKTVFGGERTTPGVITTGVFRIVRHPIYLGALLFYLGSILITLSVASAALWIVIVIFYILISRYEERLLEEEFGEDYLNYKKKVGMLFPKLSRARK